MSSYVDINGIEKSSPISVLNKAATTTTSGPLDAHGKNAVLVKIVLSGTANWTISVQGAFNRNDTYIDLYELANTGAMAKMTYQTNSSKMILFKGIPNWIKIVATEDVDGETCSIDVQFINV